MDTEIKTSTLVTFEQPLNEHMRICLRLEQLFKEVRINLHETTEASSLLTLNALLKILNVVDRPDIKAKLTQTLRQHLTALNQLKQSPKVNGEMLTNIISELEQHLETLHQQTERFGDQIRDNDFLHQVRLQLNNPGGICEYNAPALKLWLKQPNKKRTQDLQSWVDNFSQLQKIVTLILQLIRQSAEPLHAIAEDGFYCQTLNSHTPCSIVRLTLKKDQALYPEFSVGKHRLSIRFLSPNYHNGRPLQTKDTVEFDLTLCRV